MADLSTTDERDDYDEIWRTAYGEMQDRGPVHRHMRRMVAQLLAGIEYESAIEVGCGAGHNLPLLRAHGSNPTLAGVDISPVALEEARTRESHASFELLDIERQALPGRWDLVFSSLVLEHIVDDEAAIRNMATMAGRWVLVTTIAGNFERYRPWDEQMGHVRNYAVGELEAKFSRAGLEVSRTIYWGFPFYTPLVRTLQNRMTSEPEFTPLTAFLAKLTYAVYHLNSRRRGDLLIALARVPGSS